MVRFTQVSKMLKNNTLSMKLLNNYNHILGTAICNMHMIILLQINKLTFEKKWKPRKKIYISWQARN